MLRPTAWATARHRVIVSANCWGVSDCAPSLSASEGSGWTSMINPSQSAATRSKRVPAITKPKFDPTARKVELFKGIKDGSLTAQLILKNSRQGNV